MNKPRKSARRRGIRALVVAVDSLTDPSRMEELLLGRQIQLAEMGYDFPGPRAWSGPAEDPQEDG